MQEIEEMKKEDVRNLISWNIAKQHSDLISALISESAILYKIGNMPKLFCSLCTIREMINHNLNQFEIKRFDKIERDACRYIRDWKKGNENRVYDLSPDKKTSKGHYMFFKIVKYYQRLIMKTLKKQGFFPSKAETRYLMGAE